MARAMKDSGIEWLGEIPADWEIVQLKRFVSVNNGREVPEEIDKTADAVPVYGSGGVFKYTTDYLYKGEAVMFGRKGTLGKPIYANEKLWTVDTMYFLTFSEKLFAKFNYYQLCAFDWEPHITQTALPSIVASEIVSCKFAFPSLDEQQRIAAFLDGECARIDSVVEKTRASIEEYRKLKQSIITRAVTKGIRPNRPTKDSGIDWLGDIPADWELAQLKRFVFVNNGRETLDEVDKTEDVVPVYGSGGVFKYTTTPLYSGETVMFGRKGTLGKPIYANEKLWTVDTMYFLTFSEKLFAKFNYYQLCAFDWEPHITQTALPSIVASEIVSCKFAFPPLDEQKEIAAYLDEKTAAIDSLVAKKNQLVSELESLKKSLIFEYVTGKKEVPT